MTIGEFLAASTAKLKKSGIETPRLDCLVLLEDTLGQNRAQVLAHLDNELTPTQINKLNKNVTQRLSHVPIAYIRGKTEFYGRDFIVNSHVLVPRPETEAIIDLLKDLNKYYRIDRLADIGTGSGCIGITAGLETKAKVVDLYDISDEALAVAKVNAKKYKVRANFIASDLLDKSQSSYDVILANLPYVPNDYPINKAAGHEPNLALFAGDDGLDLYHRFWDQLSATQDKPLYVLIESLTSQHKTMIVLARMAGYSLSKAEGLIQQFRLSQ